MWLEAITERRHRGVMTQGRASHTMSLSTSRRGDWRGPAWQVPWARVALRKGLLPGATPHKCNSGYFQPDGFAHRTLVAWSAPCRPRVMNVACARLFNDQQSTQWCRREPVKKTHQRQLCHSAWQGVHCAGRCLPGWQQLTPARAATGVSFVSQFTNGVCNRA